MAEERVVLEIQVDDQTGSVIGKSGGPAWIGGKGQGIGGAVPPKPSPAETIQSSAREVGETVAQAMVRESRERLAHELSRMKQRKKRMAEIQRLQFIRDNSPLNAFIRGAKGAMGRGASAAGILRAGGRQAVSGAIALGGAKVAGPIAVAVAGAIAALASFRNAVKQTTEAMEFNGRIASAMAQRERTQLAGKIRRADIMAPQLTRFTQARTQLGEELSDLMMQFQQVMLPPVEALVRAATALLSTVNSIAEFVDSIYEVMNNLIDEMAAMMPPEIAVVFKALARLVTGGLIEWILDWIAGDDDGEADLIKELESFLGDAGGFFKARGI